MHHSNNHPTSVSRRPFRDGFGSGSTTPTSHTPPYDLRAQSASIPVITRKVAHAAVTRLPARTAAAIVSVDVPSGLDADTGRPLGACIRANVTATMVAPKLGMSNPESAAWTGRIEVIDIGTPSDLLIEFGITTRSGPIEDDVEDVRPPAT